jgi:DNA repair protein RecO (recombination protein O)
MMSGRFEVLATPIDEGLAPSASSPASLDEAIVLHTRAYRETSYLVDLLTRDRGRLRLLAKGVRRGRQPSADLSPFSRIRFTLGGRGELRLLTSSEAVPGWQRLEGEGLYCGFYVAELLMRLLPLEDAHPELYEEILSVLRQLGEGMRPERLLRRFERALLEELGYGLSLWEDTLGNPIEAEAFYQYQPEHGAQRVKDAQTGIPGSALIALATGDFEDPRDLVFAKKLMRGILDRHLEGRPLKSRELFQTFSRRNA